MKEKLCPICSKIIRSDAEVHKYCTLCGMGIPEYLSVPNHIDKDGKILWFCCSRCRSIFETEIFKKNNINRI
ncbi:MAG: hypothetical protein ACFFDF_14275 [Candidatus Odinarchaeota archaeon]